jgi:hypothetical protein
MPRRWNGGRTPSKTQSKMYLVATHLDWPKLSELLIIRVEAAFHWTLDCLGAWITDRIDRSRLRTQWYQ